MELSQRGPRRTGNPAREEMKTLSLARKAIPGMQTVTECRGGRRLEKSAKGKDRD